MLFFALLCLNVKNDVIHIVPFHHFQAHLMQCKCLRQSWLPFRILGFKTCDPLSFFSLSSIISTNMPCSSKTDLKHCDSDLSVTED